MNSPETNPKPFIEVGKDKLDESLVIPLDGYAVDEEDRGKKRFYGFQIGEVNLLIDPGVRSEVFSDMEITPVPLMPDYVLGLCSVRGSLVPVYDLNKKLDVAVNNNEVNKRILILDDDENMAGIQVEDMVASYQFDEQDMQDDVQSELESINEYLTYSYRQDGKYYFGFNHIKLFSS